MTARLFLTAIFVALGGCSAGSVNDPVPPLADKVIVIAHRGASGVRPEHTLESYAQAIAGGADYIEPDLVLTKDGVLVARHENEISETTNVADHPEFADRKTEKKIDGETYEGWFTEDFTLAELKTLRARERLPQLRPGNKIYDGKFGIPTFEEILELVKAKEAETGRRIGLYPETKHPSYFAAIGLPHEAPLLALLARYGYHKPEDPMFIQSFEVGNLKALAAKTDVHLVQLMAEKGGPADRPDLSYAKMASPEGLKAVAAYADGVGPEKVMVIAPDFMGKLSKPTDFVRNAHAVGLLVHPWTFRAENHFLPLALRSGVSASAQGNLDGEIEAFLRAGVDGIFTDFPAAGVKAVRGGGEAGPAQGGGVKGAAPGK